MNEKFINFNCAQMAAVAMWTYLSSFKHRCTIVYCGKTCDIQVEVYLDEGEDIEIPKGYIYTLKVIDNFVGSDIAPGFKVITFNFEY